MVYFLKKTKFIFTQNLFSIVLLMKQENMDIKNQNNDYWGDLIINQLTDTISNDERSQLKEWRNMSKKNDRVFIEMQKVWNILNLSDRNKSFDEQRAYQLFKERRYSETDIAKKVWIKRNSLFRSVASYAAVLISFVILSYFTYCYYMIESGYENKNTLSCNNRASPRYSECNQICT